MSDALARPYDPFEITPRFAWVECPLADYAGFSIRVRSNMRNRERKALLTLITDVDAERKRLGEAAQKRLTELGEIPAGGALVDLIEEMNRLQDENQARVPAAIAPLVVAWNLQEPDEQGIYGDAKPPAEAGPEAFEACEQPMLDWIVNAIVSAYRGGKTLTDSSKTRAESAEQPSASPETPPDEQPTDSPPKNDQESPENSPTPSASTST